MSSTRGREIGKWKQKRLPLWPNAQLILHYICQKHYCCVVILMITFRVCLSMDKTFLISCHFFLTHYASVNLIPLAFLIRYYQMCSWSGGFYFLLSWSRELFRKKIISHHIEMCLKKNISVTHHYSVIGFLVKLLLPLRLFPPNIHSISSSV